TTLLWDAGTGRPLPGPPDFPVRDNPLSPDGRYFAHVQGTSVRLIDLHLTDGEFALRHWATRRDPTWHAAEVERLRKEGKPQAAALHDAPARGLPPGAVGDLRHAVALARSGHCHEAGLALLRSILRSPEDEATPPS